MPTGYTAAITEKDITFKEYALSCARAFGALILMRDDPMDAPIPDSVEPSDYSSRAIKEHFETLQKLEAMTPDEQIQYGEKAKADAIKRAEDALVKDLAENQKYLAMRRKTEAWTPPTSQHVEMKKFMIEQIDISMNTLKYAEERLAEARGVDQMSLYRAAVASEKHMIQYHEKEHVEEIKRAQGRTDWIQALKKSLN